MKISNYLDKTLQTLAGLCLLVMVILVFSNAVMRYALNTGLAFSEELARICFVYLIFFGIILVAKEHKHLTVDIITSKLSTNIQKILQIIADIIVLTTCIIMVIGASKLFMLTTTLKMPATGVPQAILYGAAIISFTCYALVILYHFIKKGDL